MSGRRALLFGNENNRNWARVCQFAMYAAARSAERRARTFSRFQVSADVVKLKVPMMTTSASMIITLLRACD